MSRVLQLRKTPPSNPLSSAWLPAAPLCLLSPSSPLVQGLSVGIINHGYGPFVPEGPTGGRRKEGQELEGGKEGRGGEKEGDIWISVTGGGRFSEQLRGVWPGLSGCRAVAKPQKGAELAKGHSPSPVQRELSTLPC